MASLVYSVKIAGEKVWLGCDTGHITLLLHLGHGHLVKADSLTGHTGRVTCLEADEDLLVSGSQDNTARLWSLTTASLVRELRGHQSPVNITTRLCP